MKMLDLSKAHVLVVGDVMLDRYWRGSVSRISPEAPVPIMLVGNDEARPGGAANVAVNLKSLGCTVSLLSVTGKDEAGLCLQDKVLNYGIDADILQFSEASTTVKLRMVDKSQQLLRCDFEDKVVLSKNNRKEFLAKFSKIIQQVDVCIFSDYDKGCLADCKHMLEIAKKHKVFTCVDPKQKDFSIYTGADLVSPNLNELQFYIGKKTLEQSEQEQGCISLMQKYNISNILLTQGELGMTLLQAKEGGKSTRFSARSREVFDVTGAGDTVIAVLAACYASGIQLVESSRIANIAAGIVVKKSGVSTLSIQELNKSINKHQDSTENKLCELIDLAQNAYFSRQLGLKLVMTNGCFDILHLGHIDYLEKASSFGDCLIVAINDDASVRGLKGKSRPVNKLYVRMRMLAALSFVDWVVPFSEQTPLNIINKIQPDVLVKGADYKIDEIVGAKEVIQAGGRVERISLVPGYSTTGIIEKLTELEPA